MPGEIERVLFVHAHPDDETLSTGATIATLVNRGAEVIVLTCTRGERGEVITAELAPALATPEALGSHREGELAAALGALGVRDHRILGNANARWTGKAPRRYLDSGMRSGRSGANRLDVLDPSSLVAADPDEVVADIATVLIEIEPDVVVSYARDGGHGHPDHTRAHEATRTAAEVIGVPFYVIESSPIGKAQLTVDPTPVLDRKRAALEAHRSQIVVGDDSFSLSAGDPRPIAAAERFSRLRPPASAWSDHGIASRIAACALVLVLGAFVGATLTVAHQATVPVGGITVPWGIIAAVVITVGLLVGLRMVFESRFVVAFAAAGLLGVSAYLAIGSGSALVPSNVAGLVWTFAPTAVTIAVLGWPQSRRRAKDKIDAVPVLKGTDPK